MSSNINANNIDSAYPVAGQDNDSQGFRDNFTNIKANFQYAADEITDLQSKAVLKSALDGTVLNNNMGGSVLSNVQLQDTSETYLNLGTISGASQTINYVAAQVQSLTLGNNVTISFSDFPTVEDTAGRLRLQVTTDPSATYTLTLPGSVTKGVEFIQGYNSGTITFPKGSTTYEFEFESMTDSGTTTYSISDLTRNQDPIFLPSQEDLADAAVVSLNSTVSQFTTGGSNETATLPAGKQGQIKVLAMYSTGGGSMTITVTNAAWGGLGTISFVNSGTACTMQYINGRWFCIGNNGASFL
jgi:hypothetical protein